MVQTLCPACGFSPIAAGTEECPACGEPFTFLQTHKKAKNQFIDPEAESPEATTFSGGVTSAVTAHPYPPAVAFLAGAVLWFLRASGILVDMNEPSWLFAIAVADLIVPALLVVNVGPVKLIAQLTALGQLGATAFLGRDDLVNPVHVLFAAHAIVLMVMVTGEPGVFRRALGLSMACAAAAAGIAVLGLLGLRVSVSELGGPAQGFRLRLPSGYEGFTKDEIQHAFQLPPGETVSFGNPVQRVFGMVVVRRDAPPPLISGCEALQRALGGSTEPRPLPISAPPSMGTSALVYPLHLGAGGRGRLACAKRPDGRFVALAVVVSGIADAAVGERAGETAFEELGAGLSLL